MIIYVRHARAVLCPNGKGYCSRGMRQFAASHDLDWEDFVKNGIDSKVLEQIDDVMVKRVIAEAEKDEQG